MDRGQLVAPPMWAVDTDFSALPPPHRQQTPREHWLAQSRARVG